MPDSNQLARLRWDIDRRPQRIKTVLRNENFRREFLKGVDDDEAKVAKAFVSQNQENALKTKPKVGLSMCSRILFPTSFPSTRDETGIKGLPFVLQTLDFHRQPMAGV